MEFLEENAVTVVALREQSWLEVDGASMHLRGTGGAVLFRRGADPARGRRRRRPLHAAARNSSLRRLTPFQRRGEAYICLR